MERWKCAELWVSLHQIKARQQHDESHSWEAGDLFKEGCSQERARETSVGMQSKGGKGVRKKNGGTCWLTVIIRLRQAERLTRRVNLTASPSEGRSEELCDWGRATEWWNKTVLQHEIAPLSLYSHLSADRMMQSEEGNRSPIAVQVKPKAKNKVLIRETATGSQLVSWWYALWWEENRIWPLQITVDNVTGNHTHHWKWHSETIWCPSLQP